MKYKILKLSIILLFTVIAIFTLFGCQENAAIDLSETEHEYTFYLPVLVNSDKYGSHPYPYAQIGVHVFGNWEDSKDFYKGSALNHNIHMVDIYGNNPLQPPNWSNTDSVFQNEDDRYIGFRGSTAWMNGGIRICNLPLPEYWELWAWTVNEAVEKYNPKWIGVLSEPDTYGEATGYYYGCIGPLYNHGVKYAEFYNYVYEYVKSRNPQVKIIAGEMQSVWNPFIDGFFDNVVEYDGFAIHHYVWASTDRSHDAIVSRVKEYTDDKELLLTETSLLAIINTAYIEQEQANYFKQIKASTDFSAIFWFTLEDTAWRYSGLLKHMPDGTTRKKAAYCVYATIPLEDCPVYEE